MTPVCPACRGHLALSAYRCSRCGLAVRPTCSACGEPLTPDATACWRCGGALDDAPLLSAPSPAATTAVLEAPAPVYTPVEVVSPSRHRVRRFVLLPVLVALLLVVVLLGYEVARPRGASVDAANVALHEQSLARSFTVEVPIRWEYVVDQGVAHFTDPDVPDGSVGMTIEARQEPLAKAGRGTSTLVDGRPALRRSFANGNSVGEEWWVTRGKGTFKIDAFARPDLADGRTVLYNRIVATFREL